MRSESFGTSLGMLGPCHAGWFFPLRWSGFLRRFRCAKLMLPGKEGGSGEDETLATME
jgi:hypothetical protein